ncbi:MAG: TetR/AcrR family transcriptional regulator [Chloroflexi bacterium]|nr:TetR/AcrR family transcriptional regulator [Chloroflexota bacterium]
MPKPTFLNLPREKQNAFLEVALPEFADNDYNSASVSRIVERAGIAKGSVYQYFEDKQDLFMYLVEVSNQSMLEFVKQTPPPAPSADFFTMLRWQMSATIQASLKHPVHAKLLRRAYSAPLPFQDAIFENARRIREEHFQAMIQQAQASGQLAPGLDVQVASFMVQGMLNELGPFLQSRFGEQTDDWAQRPEVHAVFDQVITILKNGLGK